jgi:hypothetical protein
MMSRLLTRDRLRVISAGVLLVCVGLAAYGLVARPDIAPHLNADFAGLYNAGRILNDFGPDRLYDFRLQAELYHDLIPQRSAGSELPFLHPPHVAYALAPLARLPYPVAYVVWLVLSAGIYLAGLLVLLRALPGGFAGWRLDAVLLALAFEPFVIENWLNGQLAAVGFLGFALTLAALEKGRPVLAGLALSICVYKPTLLVLVVPLLVVGRSFRVLGGFGMGAAVWLAVNVALVGVAGCQGYLDALRENRLRFAERLQMPFEKYVDLNSFVALWGVPASLRGPLALALAAIPAVVLVVAWWRSGRDGDRSRRLLWAATLAWSPVLNLYTPMYDSLGVVAAALLLVSVRGGPELSPGLRWVLVAVSVVPWVAPGVALATGIQPYTLALAVLGGYALWREWTLQRAPP